MVFKMLNGQESRNGLYYYENIEGGHGGAADSDQVKTWPFFVSGDFWSFVFFFLFWAVRVMPQTLVRLRLCFR